MMRGMSGMMGGGGRVVLAAQVAWAVWVALAVFPGVKPLLATL